MALTDLTLAEQLKLTERRIEGRKRLFDITQEDESNLLGAKSFIEKRLDELIKKFYRFLLAHNRSDVGDWRRRYVESAQEHHAGLYPGPVWRRL